MIKRLYEDLIRTHLSKYRQMIFLAGARQVGKTTLAKWTKNLTDQFYYLNWDNQDHRKIMMSGPSSIAEYLQLGKMTTKIKIVVFDELHKYPRWKNLLKGFYDTYGEQIKIIVTGSAKLNVYKKIGDSLMGRYFLYHIHPFSVAELTTPEIIDKEIRKPHPISEKKWKDLLNYGGFPEPFVQNNKRFYNQWTRLRIEQTFHEDIRNLTHIHEITQLEMLAALLKQQAGQLVNYSTLANVITVSVPTIRRWITSLNSFFYSFTVRPWHKNVSRALVKQPKIYLWDWSQVDDVGARFENMIASHLYKATQFWTDTGLGDYELFFIRDKEQHEVDFLVTKNRKPWFLVEAKNTDHTGLSKSLYLFQEQTGAEHAFQLAFNAPFIDQNCFAYRKPIIVPASTFLSQLV